MFREPSGGQARCVPLPIHHPSDPVWRCACVCQYASLPLEELLSVVEKDLAAVTNAKVTPKVGDTKTITMKQTSGHERRIRMQQRGILLVCLGLGFGVFECMMLM